MLREFRASGYVTRFDESRSKICGNNEPLAPRRVHSIPDASEATPTHQPQPISGGLSKRYRTLQLSTLVIALTLGLAGCGSITVSGSSNSETPTP